MVQARGVEIPGASVRSAQLRLDLGQTATRCSSIGKAVGWSDLRDTLITELCSSTGSIKEAKENIEK